MDQNILSKGCLVQVSFSIWEGAKGIDKKKAQEALGSDWARAKKSLIDQEPLKKIRSIKNAAYNAVRGMSLPFPIKGILFVPFGNIEKIDEMLQTDKIYFEQAVEEFLREYDYLVADAARILGPLYNYEDYPKDVRDRFSFEWRFITLGVPTESQFLSPDLVKREQEKFMQTMEDARNMGVLALRSEFKKLVDNCVDRLTPEANGNKKKFKSSLTENFLDFYNEFKSKNIFEDKELADLVDKARMVVKGIGFEELRDNDRLRGDVQKIMSTVQGEIDSAIETMPGRKICLD